MKIQGGCYCGEVRYEANGDPLFAAQCHCRKCQYIKQSFHHVPEGIPTFARTPG